jgi:hypothetical protein
VVGGIVKYLDVRAILQSELGVGLKSVGSATANYWPPVFASELELRDVLDAVTLIFRALRASGGGHDEFRQEVRRIFEEEQVSYVVDDEGGVHLKVDQEFGRSRVSAIRALAPARYAAVRRAYEEAHSALDAHPPDGKQAIRLTFSAVECLFRLMYSDAHRLSGSDVDKYLKPAIDQQFAKERIARQAAHKLAASLKDWIDAAHFYRHEPGAEDPAQPPFQLTVLIVSQGAAFLRWLADLDGQRAGQET